eukprot:443916_1
MDPTERVNWLKLNIPQIETAQKQKREEEKEKSRQIVGSLCKLEQSLLQTINSLHKAEQNLKNGYKDCTTPFIRNMQKYIEGLSNISNISSSLDNITFPTTLCDYIDQGKNPDLQMKQNYTITQSRNNLQRARIIDTHTIEQYLKNGQKYFDQWSIQKNKQNISNKNNNNNNDDGKDNDNDIDMS